MSIAQRADLSGRQAGDIGTQSANLCSTEVRQIPIGRQCAQLGRRQAAQLVIAQQRQLRGRDAVDVIADGGNLPGRQRAEFAVIGQGGDLILGQAKELGIAQAIDLCRRKLGDLVGRDSIDGRPTEKNDLAGGQVAELSGHGQGIGLGAGNAGQLLGIQGFDLQPAEAGDIGAKGSNLGSVQAGQCARCSAGQQTNLGSGQAFQLGGTQACQGAGSETCDVIAQRPDLIDGRIGEQIDGQRRELAGIAERSDLGRIERSQLQIGQGCKLCRCQCDDIGAQRCEIGDRGKFAGCSDGADLSLAQTRQLAGVETAQGVCIEAGDLFAQRGNVGQCGELASVGQGNHLISGQTLQLGSTEITQLTDAERGQHRGRDGSDGGGGDDRHIGNGLNLGGRQLGGDGRRQHRRQVLHMGIAQTFHLRRAQGIDQAAWYAVDRTGSKLQHLGDRKIGQAACGGNGGGLVAGQCGQLGVAQGGHLGGTEIGDDTGRDAVDGAGAERGNLGIGEVSQAACGGDGGGLVAGQCGQLGVAQGGHLGSAEIGDDTGRDAVDGAGAERGNLGIGEVGKATCRGNGGGLGIGQRSQLRPGEQCDFVCIQGGSQDGRRDGAECGHRDGGDIADGLDLDLSEVGCNAGGQGCNLPGIQRITECSGSGAGIRRNDGGECGGTHTCVGSACDQERLGRRIENGIGPGAGDTVGEAGNGGGHVAAIRLVYARHGGEEFAETIGISGVVAAVGVDDRDGRGAGQRAGQPCSGGNSRIGALNRGDFVCRACTGDGAATVGR